MEEHFVSTAKLNKPSNTEQVEQERMLDIEKIQPKTKSKWLLRSQKFAKSLHLSIHDRNTDKGKISRQRRRSVGELGDREKSSCHKKLVRLNTVDGSELKKMSTRFSSHFTEIYSDNNEEGEDESVERDSFTPDSPTGRRRGICEEMEKRMLCEGDSLYALREAIVVQETLKNNFLL